MNGPHFILRAALTLAICMPPNRSYGGAEMRFEANEFSTAAMALEPTQFRNGQPASIEITVGASLRLNHAGPNTFQREQASKFAKSDRTRVAAWIRNALANGDQKALGSLLRLVQLNNPASDSRLHFRGIAEYVIMTLYHPTPSVRARAESFFFKLASHNPGWIVKTTLDKPPTTAIASLFRKLFFWVGCYWEDTSPNLSPQYFSLWPQEIRMAFDHGDETERRRLFDHLAGRVLHIVVEHGLSAEVSTSIQSFTFWAHARRSAEFLFMTEEYLPWIQEALERYREAAKPLSTARALEHLEAIFHANEWSTNHFSYADMQRLLQHHGLRRAQAVAQLVRDQNPYDIVLFLTDLLSLEEEPSAKLALRKAIFLAYHLRNALERNHYPWDKLSLDRQLVLITAESTDQRVSLLNTLLFTFKAPTLTNQQLIQLGKDFQQALNLARQELTEFEAGLQHRPKASFSIGA